MKIEFIILILSSLSNKKIYHENNFIFIFASNLRFSVRADEKDRGESLFV